MQERLHSTTAMLRMMFVNITLLNITISHSINQNMNEANHENALLKPTVIETHFQE